MELDIFKDKKIFNINGIEFQYIIDYISNKLSMALNRHLDSNI